MLICGLVGAEGDVFKFLKCLNESGCFSKRYYSSAQQIEIVHQQNIIS